MSAQAIGTRLPIGFAGAISHGSDTVVTNRKSTDIIPFGGAVALNGDNSVSWIGDTGQASRFIGFAVRIVKQQTSMVADVGAYQVGELTDVLIRGTIVVPFKGQGTPQAGNPVYIRTAANPATPNAQIGDVEAQADGSNTTLLTNAVFRTGIVDNGLVEVVVTTRRV